MMCQSNIDNNMMNQNNNFNYIANYYSFNNNF